MPMRWSAIHIVLLLIVGLLSCGDTHTLPRLPNKLALTLWQTFDFFFLRWVKALAFCSDRTYVSPINQNPEPLENQPSFF